MRTQNDSLKTQNDSLKTQNDSLEKKILDSHLCVNPCLGLKGNETISADVMVDVWMGDDYHVRRVWDSEDHKVIMDIDGIAGFMDVNSTAKQRMSKEEFWKFGDRVYRDGENRKAGKCKYFVRLFNDGLDKADFALRKEVEVARHFYFNKVTY